jgi:hypothetical protein
LVIREAIPHRLFGRKTLCVGLVEIVAALGTGFSVIFPSLMIGIDQSIVAERCKTLGKFESVVDGATLLARLRELSAAFKWTRNSSSS